MIVADTNIISYLLLPTDYSADAERLLRADPEWAVPLLWRSEFRNVLALYLRKDLVTFDKALQLQEQAEFLVGAHEHSVTSFQVLRLVQSSQCSAYDCEFVALAQHLGVPLVTQDKKVLREFPDDAVSLADYLRSGSWGDFFDSPDRPTDDFMKE